MMLQRFAAAQDLRTDLAIFEELSFESIGASCSPSLRKGLDRAINGATAAADDGHYSATRSRT